jgi:outer membrane biogenesis lipoprotein LolB
MRKLALALLTAALAACSGSARPPAQQSADTLTQRQRDSTLGASKLPGAQGVSRAQAAQDSAAARNARADSIR